MCRLSSRLDRDEDAAGKLEGKVEEFTQNMVIEKKKKRLKDKYEQEYETWKMVWESQA